MLKVLLKNRLQSLMYSLTRGFRKSKRLKAVGGVGMALLLLYIAGCFIFIFWVMADTAAVLVDVGLNWLYFALAGIVAFALCFIGSVFMAQSQLYNANDNELLLSMPVRPGTILLSRMLMLYLTNLAYELCVMLPVGYAYFRHAAVTFPVVLCYIAELVLLPLLALALTCAVAWVIAVISSRMKRKNLITTIFCFAFLAAYLYLYTNMEKYISELIANGETVAAAIQRAVYPAYHYGVAAADGSWLSLAKFALCCVIPFAVVYVLLSRSFIRVATTKRSAAKFEYREKEMRVSSVKSALLVNELRRFFSSPTYIMNTWLGSIFQLVAVVYLAIKGTSVLDALGFMPQIGQMIGPLLAAAVCVMSCMNTISAPSVSLEGKRLWIIRTTPASGADVLAAKARLHIVLSLPISLIVSAVLSVIFRLPAADIVLLFAAAVVSVLLQAYFGVFVNLKMPKFDWINETVAVKQSFAVLIAMFAPLACCVLLGVLYVAVLAEVMELRLFMALCLTVLAVIGAAIRIYLNGHGGRVFESFDA